MKSKLQQQLWEQESWAASRLSISQWPTKTARTHTSPRSTRLTLKLFGNCIAQRTGWVEPGTNRLARHWLSGSGKRDASSIPLMVQPLSNAMLVATGLKNTIVMGKNTATTDRRLSCIRQTAAATKPITSEVTFRNTLCAALTARRSRCHFRGRRIRGIPLLDGIQNLVEIQSSANAAARSRP